jgi:hypothetical protein
MQVLISGWLNCRILEVLILRALGWAIFVSAEFKSLGFSKAWKTEKDCHGIRKILVWRRG